MKYLIDDEFYEVFETEVDGTKYMAYNKGIKGMNNLISMKDWEKIGSTEYQEKEISRYNKRIEIEKAIADAEKIVKDNNLEYNKFYGYMKDKTPMQRGKSKKILETNVNYRDSIGLVTRKYFIEYSYLNNSWIDTNKKHIGSMKNTKVYYNGEYIVKSVEVFREVTAEEIKYFEFLKENNPKINLELKELELYDIYKPVGVFL